MRTLLICICLFIVPNRLFASSADTIHTETFVTIESSNGGKLHGSLCRPDAESRTLVLIIAGSGPTDRDGNNPKMKNDGLKAIAHSLAQGGIASFRYDKRGIGQSADAAKSERDLRFDDYVQDAIDFILHFRSEKQYKKIIVLGHSEGSLIGMLAAVHADGFISLAGAGRPAGDILKTQLKDQPDFVKNESYALIDSLNAGKTTETVSNYLYAVFRPDVQPYLISWFRKNPCESIAALQIPVLIIQGSQDLQVGIEDAQLLHAACKQSELSLIEGMNHVFRTIAPGDNSGNIASYSNSGLPVSEQMLRLILDFAKK